MIINVGTTLIKTNHRDPDVKLIARQLEKGFTAGKQDGCWWIKRKDQSYAAFRDSQNIQKQISSSAAADCPGLVQQNDQAPG